jgi:hypothetical protein
MKIALINTFNTLPGHAGTVESFHRTRAAAESADRKLQRAVKRHNGRNSYLPTIIREVDPKAQKGMIHDSLIVD